MDKYFKNACVGIRQQLTIVKKKGILTQYYLLVSKIRTLRI